MIDGYPNGNAVSHAARSGIRGESARAGARRRAIFAYPERELEGRGYFAVGVSLRDISFVPPLANLERAGFTIPVEFKNLNAWWRRMKARPSFSLSGPPD